jgi:hypothetical protein
MKLEDQWALRVAHYTPWLTYWWNTQRWFPICSAISRSLHNFVKQDKELLTKLLDNKDNYVVRIKLLGDPKIGSCFFFYSGCNTWSDLDDSLYLLN